MYRTSLLALLMLAGASSPALAAAVPHYAVTDIGPIVANANQSIVSGPALANQNVVINNKAQVAGTFETNIPLQNGSPGNTYHPFLWQHGRRHDLGVIGIYFNASVSGINDRGQICGTLDALQNGAVLVYQNHAFLWANGKMRDLGAPPGDKLSEASAINNKGTIVGEAEKSGYPPDYSIPAMIKEYEFHGVLLNKGRWQRLSLQWVNAINDKGQLLGLMPWPQDNGASHAVLWQNGAITDFGWDHSAVAINNKGQIVINNFKGSSSAGVWQSGRMTALKVPAPYQNPGGAAINNSGAVVGSAQRHDKSQDRQCAILWRDGNGYDLNTLIPTQSGWTLQQATGINDKGQIVGIGTFHGRLHAFLLTPRP